MTNRNLSDQKTQVWVIVEGDRLHWSVLIEMHIDCKIAFKPLEGSKGPE